MFEGVCLAYILKVPPPWIEFCALDRHANSSSDTVVPPPWIESAALERDTVQVEVYVPHARLNVQGFKTEP